MRFGRVCRVWVANDLMYGGGVQYLYKYTRNPRQGKGGDCVGDGYFAKYSFSYILYTL